MTFMVFFISWKIINNVNVRFNKAVIALLPCTFDFADTQKRTTFSVRPQYRKLHF